MSKPGNFKVVHPDASTCPIADPEIEGASSFVEVDRIANGRRQGDEPQAACSARVLHIVVKK